MNESLKVTFEQAFESAGGYLPLDVLNTYVVTGGDLYTTHPDSGWTLLDIAVEMEQSAVIDLLLGAGFDINRANRNGWCAIHHSVDYDIDGAIQTRDFPIRFELTEILLRRGASLSVTTPEGYIPRDVAALFGLKPLSAFDEFLTEHLR